jgi:imidazolonepropionase-like amidohydrolase
MPSAEAWRLPPTVLPNGQRRELWIRDGQLTDKPIRGAEALPGRFALPGLVDAHAHVSTRGFAPADLSVAEANLRAMRDSGVLLVRDVGSPKSVTLQLRPGPDLPALQVAGRWLAPKGRFFDALHDPVGPEGLIEAALHEVAAGARWVKVIADWRDPSLSYKAALLHRLVDAVHAAGARVAAHTQWQVVRDVVAAGVDSIEHGSLLDAETLALMAERGIAWTPTITAFSEALPPNAEQERIERRSRILDNVRAMLPVAASRGVTILAGTDTAGTLVDEIRNLIAYGLTPEQALRAATTDARRYLGAPALEVGAAADVVTFDADPRDDPNVLARPAAIVLRGRRIL